MWFFRSFSYLRRPSFRGLAPSLVFLAVYWVFKDLPLSAFGIELSALGLAVFTALSLTLARNLPYSDARKQGFLGFLAFFVVAILLLGFWATITLEERVIQTGIVIGWVAHTLCLALIVFTFPPEDLARINSQWASTHPMSRMAMGIVTVRFAVEAAGASALMLYGTVGDWVLFLSVGRIFLHYFFDWIIILTIMTMPDEEP